MRERFDDEQLADLAALGLDWDGPVVRQSERIALYEEALGALRAAGLVYACWCTRAEIREAASAPHGDAARGRLPRHLPAPDRGRSAPSARRAGRPPALRVRADAARVAFDDRLAGRFEGVVDDFVVRRNDGAFAYNLAVVVDDAEQGVGEVVRGADLLGLHAAPAVARRAARARPPRATPTCRSCSAPTASGWPSATAP